MIAPEVAWDKLSSLQSADEIRDYFLSEGILGFQGRPMSCPIAVWMSDQTGMLTTVSSQVRVGGTTDDPWDGEVVVRFEHSHATYQFMTAFDASAYPELDRQEQRQESDCG